MNEKSRTPKWRRAGKLSYLYLAIFAGLSAFPFYWMFIVASNGNEEISKIPPSLVPGARFLKVMHDVYSVVPFNRALFNTFVVGVVVATAQVFFSALAGFAFAKLRFRGKRTMLAFVVGTMMLPSQLGIIPLFMMIAKIGWIDDLKALIVPALVSAFGVFWMRQVIDSQVPNELLEAASIDRASLLRTYWSVVLPAIRHVHLHGRDRPVTRLACDYWASVMKYRLPNGSMNRTA